MSTFCHHQVCSSTSVTPQEIEDCTEDHGTEGATELDDQEMTALHILCLNPDVAGDCIRAYIIFKYI